MTQALDRAEANPILDALAHISTALDGIAEVNPVFMDVQDKTTALNQAAALGTRLTELRLRILADADDVAAQTGARDIASWESFQAHTRLEDARADRHLALALDRRYHALATAMRDGLANHAQALVITRALDNLPDDLPAELLDKAEARLVDHCNEYGPQTLARLGRRILEVVAPDIVDQAEARRLSELEAAAHRKTKLTLRALGDGTTRISGLIPDATAQRLATYLTAFTNPRVREPAGESDTGAPDRAPRLPYPRKLGQAFCSFLERYDPQRLPVHGGDATTLMVTIPLADLRKELGIAEILGGLNLPGDGEEQISAADARRLACTANIVPVVLGGDSEILDLGRTRRFFSRAQNRALILRDRCCRAEGCDVPGTWAEAHHLREWSRGGATNLDDGVLLCSHHHHRIHDELNYRVELLPNGDLRFHRRT